MKFTKQTKVLNVFPSTTKKMGVVPTFNPSTQRVEAEGALLQ